MQACAIKTAPLIRRLQACLGPAALVSSALAFVCLLATPTARADRIPGFSSWSEFHFSLDTAPIRIVFTHPKAATGSFPALVIPRAYVYYAHRPSEVSGPLAPVVETDTVGLHFMEGNGEAYSTAFVTFRDKHNWDDDRAADKLRPQVYDVQLNSTMNPNQGQFLREGARWPGSERDDFEGLEGHKVGGTLSTYYVGDDTDVFWRVSCPGPPNPRYLCTFSIPITTGISAQVSIADFRLHGGRAEANRRLRFAREVVCRYLERC